MRDLKQSVSWSALTIALGCLATPALAQQSATTTQDQAGSKTPAVPPSTDAGDVSQAKVGDAAAGLTGTDAATKDSDPGDVTVTGTRLGRPNIGSPAPIVTITSTEIKQQGATSVSEILNRLPQVAPDNQATYQDSTGKQQVQLRGLGFNRTLSLIDGQRISTAIGIDVNSIPVALIDRIDVLTGGAASVYGADAVSGVINFILKKDFTGLQINGSNSLYMHNNDGNNLGARTAAARGLPVTSGNQADGAIGNINAAFGAKFFDDRLKLQGFVGYLHTDPVRNDARDYSTCYLTQNGAINTTPTCLLSTSRTTYGKFTPGSGPNSGVTYSDSLNGSRTFVPNDSSFFYNPYTTTYFQRQDERYNVGAFASFEVSPALELHANYLYTKDKSGNEFFGTGLLDAGSYGFSNPYTIGCNSPLLSAQQRTVVCGANAGTATQVPIGVQYRFQSVEPATDRFDNVNQRVTGGAGGRLFDDLLKYDLNFVYSQSRTRHSSDPSFGTPSYANIQNALNNCATASPGCVPLDIFQANSGSQALIDYIFGTTRGINDNISSLYDYTGNLAIDLGKIGLRSPFAKDGLQIALGAEYRLDKQRNRVDAAFLDQESGGNYDNRQDVREAYVEASVPLAQHQRFADLLSLTGSFRGSKYSIGPKVFTTWQIGGLYAPIPDITFRVSFNKASRQPTLYEYGNGIISFGGGGSDPCATTPAVIVNGKVVTPAIPPRATQAQCANTGVTAAQYGNIPQCDANSCLARSNAAHPDPETAHTQTFGLLLKPRFIPGLTLSVDRYKIQIDNQIGYSYDSDYVNGCIAFGIPFYCSHIIRNADGSLTSASAYRPGTTPTAGFVTYGTGNFYKYSNRGYDFQGQYTVPAPVVAGTLNFIFNGSLLTQIGGEDDPTFTQPRNGAGYFGTFVGIPRPKWSHTLRGTYTTEDKKFSASANWRHIGGTETTANSGDPLFGAQAGGFQNLTGVTDPVKLFAKLPSYDYLDLNFSVRVNEHFSMSVLANNLFDTNPPIVSDSYNLSNARSNTIPQTYDPLGRFVQISASVTF